MFGLWHNILGCQCYSIDWYHFRPPRFPLTPQMGNRIGGGVIISHWNCGQTTPDRAKLCTDRYWEVMGGLSIGTTPDPRNSPNPQIFRSVKTPPSNYSQTVADGATLWIDRRCEIVVVANAPKYSFSWFTLKFAGSNICEHISGLSPTNCGLFLLLVEIRAAKFND